MRHCRNSFVRKLRRGEAAEVNPRRITPPESVNVRGTEKRELPDRGVGSHRSLAGADRLTTVGALGQPHAALQSRLRMRSKYGFGEAIAGAVQLAGQAQEPENRKGCRKAAHADDAAPGQPGHRDVP